MHNFLPEHKLARIHSGPHFAYQTDLSTFAEKIFRQKIVRNIFLRILLKLLPKRTDRCVRRLITGGNMDAKKQSKYREKLLDARSKVINRLNHRQQTALVLNQDDLTDETDHAASLIQQSVALNMQERDRYVLREIENALAKMEDGTYGLCEDSEEPIDEGRLDAEPWTRYSVEAAEIREKKARRYAVGGGRGSMGGLD